MDNQLEVIIKESNLEPSKAKYILDNFKHYFELASEWENKARAIVVTDEKQTTEMEMARVGRLFLRGKRIDVENARKKLKEQCLREGKAIDGISNVLKAVIVPIEEYLEKQEKFVEIREANKQEALRIAEEKRIEEERLAKEKAGAEERERLKIENEKLRAEAVEKEKKLAEERKAQEEALKKQKDEADRLAAEERKKQQAILDAERAKAEADRKAIEEKNRLEREERERKLSEERKKEESERKIAFEKSEAERKEKERLAELLKNQVECPNCHHKFQLKGETVLQ